jgi:hypothetical protein
VSNYSIYHGDLYDILSNYSLIVKTNHHDILSNYSLIDKTNHHDILSNYSLIVKTNHHDILSNYSLIVKTNRHDILSNYGCPLLRGDNLVVHVFYYLNASEIWPNNRVDL